MNDEQPESSEGPTTSLDEGLLAQAREAAAGHPGLEDALRRLEALDEVDLDQHPAEFDAIHRALRAALTDAGDPAGVPGHGRQDPDPAGVPGHGRQDPDPAGVPGHGRQDPDPAGVPDHGRHDEPEP